MEVNGPIVSIQYGAEKSLPPLTASIGITNKLRFDQTSFVGSPGAHGCMYKQPYRSSLYDVRSPIHAEITADKSDFFSINAASNTGSLKLTEADSGRNPPTE
ncbi:hypothetical protein PRIPAC_95601 [Pristionchus pacificus]|nr:hypothetical protein PRIPAC_95601 [Pristionchus pacificus]